MTVHDPKLGKRVAVIIDAENVSCAAARQYLATASRTAARLAIADWSQANLAPYAELEPALGVRLIHCFRKPSGSKRKSRSDYAICGEAIRELATGAADEVIILSDDLDFDAFVAACGRHQQIRRQVPPPASPKSGKVGETLGALRAAVPQGNDGIALNALGKAIKAREHGFSTLSKLVQHFPEHVVLKAGKVYRVETA